MTVCAAGYEPQGGSSESDCVCVFKREHIGLIIFAFLLVIVLVVGGILYRYKNKTGCKDIKKMNQQIEYKHPEEVEEEEEKNKIIASPTDDKDLSFFPGQETGYPSTPVESEYSDTPTGTTSNGFALSQDNKEHKISIPDTQGNEGFYSQLSSEYNSV
ncbi:hypothetical protein NL108_015588 [Boleophthalmus pectinirostris]|nr:hypothetical protein NL108_015588 [Boleophthalmus pectinirostris]